MKLNPAQLAAPSRPTSITPGIYDDFSGAAGNLGGRQTVTGVTIGGQPATWTQDSFNGGNATTPKLDGSGRLVINNGTSPDNAGAFVTPARPSPARWVAVRLAVASADAPPTTGAPLCLGLHKIATNTYSFLKASLNPPTGPALGPGAVEIDTNSSGNLKPGFPTGNFNTGVGPGGAGLNGGDVIGYELRIDSSGRKVVHSFLNGRQISDGGPRDLTALNAGANITMASNLPYWDGAYGILGGTQGTSNPTPAIQGFWCADAMTEACVRAYKPGKTLSRTIWKGFPGWTFGGSADDVLLPVVFDYNVYEPRPGGADFTVSVYYLTGTAPNIVETPLPGYSSIPISSFAVQTTVAAGGVWGRAKGKIEIAAADVIAAGGNNAVFTARIERKLPNGQYAYAYMPVMRPGHNVLTTGQSIVTHLWQAINITSVTYADPPNCWQADGSADAGSNTPSTPLGRRVTSSTSTNSTGWTFHNTPQGYYCSTLQALLGSTTSITFIRSGFGGTTTQQRNPIDGTATSGDASLGAFPASVDGIGLAGDFGIAIGNDWTFDIDKVGTAPGTSADLPTQITLSLTAYLKQITAWEALVGHPLLVIMSAAMSTETVSNGLRNGTDSDLRAQALYRAKWVMCQPGFDLSVYGYTGISKFVFSGSDGYDINRVDNYHPDGSLYGASEVTRRYAYATAFALGAIPHDRMGPNATGIASYTSNSVTVTIDRRGADSLALSNGAANSGAFGSVTTTQDPHCGFAFTAGDATFASGNRLTPSAMPTFSDNGDGTTNVTWSFSGTPFQTIKPCVRPPYGSAPCVPTPYSTNYRPYISSTYSMIVGVYGSENVIPVQRYYSSAFNANPGTDYLIAP